MGLRVAGSGCRVQGFVNSKFRFQVFVSKIYKDLVLTLFMALGLPKP